jgi:hypothetical protein
MVGCVAAINVNALCHNGIPAESERTSLRWQAAGRGTPGPEAWPARDRAEWAAHRPREGRYGDRPWPLVALRRSPAELQILTRRQLVNERMNRSELAISGTASLRAYGLESVFL